MSQKLTEEELEKVQGLFNEMNGYKIALAEIEMSIISLNENKGAISSKISASASSIKAELEALEEKYGKVKINVTDGTISEQEE